MRAGIEPGGAAAEQLDLQLTALKIPVIHVRDLQLAARRRRKTGGDIEHLVVIEIEPGHRVVRLRLSRLLLDAERAALGVELHDTVTLRVLDVIGEYGRAVRATSRFLQLLGQSVAVKQVDRKSTRL